MRNNKPFFKESSYSGRRSRCVSVARLSDCVLVKDSRKETPVLSFSKEEWQAFVAGVKAGEFDFDFE